MRKVFLILFLLIFFTAPALAGEKLHALAMHGKPLYSDGYNNFGYVNPEAPKGGILKLAVNGSFDNLNRLTILGRSAAGLNYSYDKLMARAWDEPFTLYGLVAENIEIADDRSWIIFHLNKNARFHDGVAMTTADVEFSFNAYKEYGHPVRRRVYGLVNKVEIISDHSIKFTFGEGYDYESALILALMEVLPKHYWSKDGNDVSKTTLEPPLGSGPYKIKKIEAGRKVVYERVKDYWAKDLPVNKGLYNFDSIVYNYYRDDSVSLQSFKAQDYDVRIEQDIQKWKTDYEFKALSEGKVVMEEVPHKRPEWLKSIIFNTRRDLFKDIRVRKALSMLFDFDWINKNFYFNTFKRVDSVFVNSELASTNKWQPEQGNIRSKKRKAIALLKEAGWSYSEQKLIDAEGEPFSFEILVNSPNDEKLVLAYARSLEKIGIDVSVRYVDSAQFAGRLDEFDFDMVVYRWINSLSPGAEQLNYWGSEAASNKGSRNYAGVNSELVDNYASAIAKSRTREGLVENARALDDEIMNGYYFIPLHYFGKTMLARDVLIKRPDYTPIYGVVQEGWWRELE